MPEKKKIENPGNEDRSILHDNDQDGKKSYPRPEVNDRQHDNQPEFIETDPNKKDNGEQA